jgi:hypothetical protein
MLAVVKYLGLNNFKLNLLKLAPISIVTVSTQVNATTTVVDLADDELDDLLEVVYNEIGNSNEISLTLLQGLGLDTPTVIEYLQNLGYLISIFN